MNKCYKYEIRPNKYQSELIQKTFGCCRFVYNQFLDLKIKLWQKYKISLTFFKCNLLLTCLKNEYEWLKEPDKNALQNALRNLDNAYQGFFKNGRGFPKFKSKHYSTKSYKTNLSGKNIEFLGNKIKLPKLGKIKLLGGEKLIPQGRIISATISQNPDGKYYVSICCELEKMEQLPKTGRQTGIDLGIKEFATFSDGLSIDNPRFYGTLEPKI